MFSIMETLMLSIKLRILAKLNLLLIRLQHQKRFKKSTTQQGSQEVFIDSLAGLDYRSIAANDSRGDQVHWGTPLLVWHL